MNAFLGLFVVVFLTKCCGKSGKMTHSMTHTDQESTGGNKKHPEDQSIKVQIIHENKPERCKGLVLYLITPLMPISASELLTNSTSVPVGASSMIVVWKVEDVKTGKLSFISSTRTVTVPVPLRDGEPGDAERRAKETRMSDNITLICLQHAKLSTFTQVLYLHTILR